MRIQEVMADAEISKQDEKNATAALEEVERMLDGVK